MEKDNMLELKDKFDKDYFKKLNKLAMVKDCELTEEDYINISEKLTTLFDEFKEKNKNDIINKNTLNRVERAELGVIIAFKCNDKVFSGKIIKKSSKLKKLIVECVDKRKYIVSFENVVWVKTGKRFPRWVIEMFRINK